MERIRFQFPAEFLFGQPGGDELLTGRGIHPIKTGKENPRRRDAQMHLSRTGVFQQPYGAFGGGAADDRVVDEHDPLAGDDRPVGREFHPHA